MNKINISMILPTLDTGGAESMAVQLAKEINDRKFQLNFICLSSSNRTAFEKELTNSGVNVLYLNKGSGFSFRTFFRLWRILDINKTDIVHTHLGSCLYVFPWIIFHKVKLIHTIHSTPLKELPYLHRVILKKMYKVGKAIPIAISEKIKEQSIEVYNLNKNMIHIIYNPVDSKKFCSVYKNQNHDYVTYVCVARLVEVKNHKMLINAFSIVKQKINNAVLLLAGDGQLRESLQEETMRLNLNDSVKFLGNVSNIPELLGKSDIFVLSSFYEGLPMTILEAMASRLPIIATKVGGVSDIVKDNGILIESNDVYGFAQAMIELATNNNLRDEMSMIGFKLSKQYDISIITKQYENIYEKYSVGW